MNNALGDLIPEGSFAKALREYASEGFEIIYSETFDGHLYGDEPEPKETFVVLWRDGILLTCESFNGDGINKATMFYNWRPNNQSRPGQYMMSGTTFKDVNGEKVVSGYHDASHKFVVTLATLEQNGTFLSTWESMPYIWLSHYMDWCDDSETSEEKYARKFAKFPKHVRDAMNGIG